MTSERHATRAAVYIILRRNEHILVSRRYNTGYRDGEYSLPAGHVDGGESARMAAVREAFEETGITISPEDIRLVHVMHRGTKPEYIDLFFEVSVFEGEPRICEPDKCDDVRWVHKNELPIKCVSEVRMALSNIDAGIIYSDTAF